MAQASDFVSMRPRYRVSDWDSTLPLMQSFTESAALDPTDLLFQDWSSTDDSIFGRSLFRNVDALLRSLDRSSNLMNMMSAGPAPMSALEFHGSADDLAKIQAALPKIQGAPDVQIDFYDSGTGYKTASADRIGMEEVDRSKVCSTYPYFEVSDWSTAEPIMQEILQKTSNEAGCIHFAWTRSGNRLRWHGYYTTGDALKAHVEAIRPLMDQPWQALPRLIGSKSMAQRMKLAKLKTSFKELPRTQSATSQARSVCAG